MTAAAAAAARKKKKARENWIYIKTFPSNAGSEEEEEEEEEGKKSYSFISFGASSSYIFGRKKKKKKKKKKKERYSSSLFIHFTCGAAAKSTVEGMRSCVVFSPKVRSLYAKRYSLFRVYSPSLRIKLNLLLD